MTIFSAAIEIMRDLGFPNGLPEIVIGYVRTMEDRFDKLLRIHGGSRIVITSNISNHHGASLEIKSMGDGWICTTCWQLFGTHHHNPIEYIMRHLMCGTFAGIFVNKQKSPEIYKIMKHLANQLRMILLKV